MIDIPYEPLWLREPLPHDPLALVALRPFVFHGHREPQQDRRRGLRARHGARPTLDASSAARSANVVASRGRGDGDGGDPKRYKLVRNQGTTSGDYQLAS